MTTTQLKPIACGSTDPRVIKAAAEFPAKLFAVHGDKIVIRDSAVYFGDGTTKGSRGKGIDVSCSVFGHEWSPAANSLLKGYGCPECRRLKNIASAGTRRRRPSNPEERQRAAELREQGLTYKQVADELGRDGATIQTWLSPKKAEKSRIRNAKRREKHRDYIREVQRNYLKTSHGRASSRNNDHIRRLLKTNTPELVFLDGEWHEVDRKETYKIWSPFLVPHGDRREMDELAMEADRLAKETGVAREIDHIQPLSKGGEHLPFNLQILPASENRSKHDTFRLEDQRKLAIRLFFDPTTDL